MKNFSPTTKSRLRLLGLVWLSVVLAMVSVAPVPAGAQIHLPIENEPDADAIIRKFIASETKFRETLMQFAFKRDVLLQTIGPDGEVTGEYIRNSNFVLDDRGKRCERVLYHPSSTIKQMKITKEDVQDLAGSQLLGLEVDDFNKYDLSLIEGPTACDKARVSEAYRELLVRARPAPKSLLASQAVDEGEEPEGDDTPIVDRP